MIDFAKGAILVRKNFQLFSSAFLGTIILLIMTTISWGDQFFNSQDYWTKFFPVTNQATRSNGITLDQAGNIYLLLEVYNDQLGTMESLLIKSQPDGKELWSRHIEVGAARTSAQAVTIDRDGNYYLTGFIEGQIDNQDLIGEIQAFLVKYRPDGQREWLKIFGAIASWTSGTAIVLDQANNCYLTGFTNNDLDGENLIGETDLFLTKYSSTGTQIWTRLLGVAEKNTNPTAIAIDQQANLYLTGYTNGSLGRQNISIPLDAFVAKYDSTGNMRWTRLIGATGTSEDRFAEGLGVAVDQQGNCWVAGDTNGVLRKEKRIGIIDTFIIKYNPDGNQIRSKLLGVPHANTSAQGILIDQADNLYLYGVTDGQLEGQSKTGHSDTFITKYTTDTQSWTKLFGFNEGRIYGVKLAITNNNLLYLAGTNNVNLEEKNPNPFETAFLSTYLRFDK